MRRLVVAACIALVLFRAGPARAQDAASLQRAKDLFHQGNELRKAGDCAGALAFYLESRSLVPSVANTMNTAVCLQAVGLEEDALELYEELLVKFRAELTDDESRALGVAMALLRPKLGRVNVSSNVRGLVVIDGRTRGQLPLLTPISVGPGVHVLRVIKDGYETFEQSVSIQAGALVAVDAKLVALALTGHLRVEVAGGEEGADVVIDGALIGHAPWEGALAPGPHLLIVRKGPRGTRPMQVVVVENQTVAASPALAPLGPDFRVVPDPPSSRLWVDGVTVGTGEWRGALPLGPHAVEAREEGYSPLRTAFEVTESPLVVVTLRLEIDPAHPRWGAKRSGRLWAEASGALAVGTGLGSGAEASCERVACSDRKPALGGMFGARVGYELPSGLSVHLGGGYLALRTTLARKLGSSFASTGGTGGTAASTQVPLSYDLQDTIDFSGPFASTGLGYALPLGHTFEIGARAELGVVLARASDSITGAVTGGGRTVDLAVQRSGSAAHGAAPFVLPEIVGRARFGRVYVGVGAALGIFFVSGPSLDTGDVAPRNFDCRAHPGAADCAPANGLLRGERAFGPALVGLPTAHVGAIF